ncbi:hypothetical protein BC941DRAFT_456598 [Chlamydoabsidia padenii]|nr:hypothetical protein BC941DRAFT_456598 [Chlamydoabsidia padenii]
MHYSGDLYCSMSTHWWTLTHEKVATSGSSYDWMIITTTEYDSLLFVVSLYLYDCIGAYNDYSRNGSTYKVTMVSTVGYGLLSILVWSSIYYYKDTIALVCFGLYVHFH